MAQLCRTCGQEAEHTRELFDKENTEILKNIRNLTGIWLTDKDGVPTSICVSCLLDLKEAIAFRERCIKTNNVWFEKRDNPEELDTVGREVALEKLPRVSEKETKEEDDILSRETIEPAYPLETQEAMPAEVLDPLLDDEAIKTENESQHSDTESGDSGSPQPKEKSRKESTRKKWARAKRVHAKKEGLYFCDQCGKSFSEKGNFNVHLTRHTGLKQFACEECDRKEFTLHLLKLHVRIKHRGELPYVCKYCGQRFDNCIKRLRHERGHKESPVVRPHTCAICKKAFKDKITLRYHAVVHSGEQAFHCELCQAHFNRRSSLRTHFRSKLHIKKAEEQEQQKPGDQD